MKFDYKQRLVIYCMSKILTLLAEEARQLNFNFFKFIKLEPGKKFIPVTYLGAYGHLRIFILSIFQKKI